MKKLTAILLGLVLLCSAALAGAAEGTAEPPYLETESQDVYLSSTVLTEASYPQACISPYGAYAFIESDYKEPWFVSFPGPEGAACSEFAVDSCDYLDIVNFRQYSYQATDS